MSDRVVVKTVGKLFGSSGSGRVKFKTISDTSRMPTKSCIPEVIKKLRRHPDYQDPSLVLKSEAEDLTDTDKIMDRFFSSMTHELVHDRIKDRAEEMNVDLTTTYERKAQTTRAINRVEQVARFEVKLLLRYVNRRTSPPPRLIGRLASALQMEYGPLHALLLINNEVIIEWNSSSLVIPKFIDPDTIVEHTGPVLVSATIPDIMHIQRQLSKPFEDYDEVDLILEAACKKSELLRKLAGIIARYNSHYYYDIIFRNCQNFVLDALTAIGCKNKPEFSGNLRNYFTHLKSKGRVMASFETHDQLDAYVRKNHTTLTKENMEYLLAQYCLFHMQRVMKSGELEDWDCKDRDCMMDFLEAKIDETLLIMHQFLHPVTAPEQQMSYMQP